MRNEGLSTEAVGRTVRLPKRVNFSKANLDVVRLFGLLERGFVLSTYDRTVKTDGRKLGSTCKPQQ